MLDDTMTDRQNEEKNNDDGTTTALSTSLIDFEFQECKPEPCSDIDSPSEDAMFPEFTTVNVPISTPTLKDPIVLLERCDKIWETLKMIKTIQNINPIVESNEKKEDEKESYFDMTKEAASDIDSQATKSSNTVPLPFQFSVQRTRKVYPCTICGKHYMENRSLRRHSERVHRIILPLQRRGIKPRNNLKFTDNKNITIILSDEENTNSEQFSNNENSHKITTSKTANAYFKCTLCQQKVKSLRKHLIQYHKIGSSSNMMKELESSLLSGNKISSENNRITPKGTPRIIPQIFANKDTQDKFAATSSKYKAPEISQVRKKRKYTLSQMGSKKRLNIERYMSIPSVPIIKSGQIFSNNKSYKCEVCLGTYSSANSYAKHKRFHIKRGETRENFHTFRCRYLNSPLNDKYQTMFSGKSNDQSLNTVKRNYSNRLNEYLRFNDIKREVLPNKNRTTSIITRASARYNEKINKSDNTCICGRSFRSPHTLYFHKNACKLCKRKDKTQSTLIDKVSSDSDSGIGLNITIKKRNDSYEIVGKDSDENKLKNSNNLENDASSTNMLVDNTVKENSTDTIANQQADTSKSSEYDKNHSILKLEVVDEDMVVDVEDDKQIASDEINEEKHKADIVQEHHEDSSQKDENMEDTKICGKVQTLTQMCHEVLDQLAAARKTESADHTENVKPENKRNLRGSLSRNCKNVKKYDYMYDEPEIYITKDSHLDVLSRCAYCDERFSTIDLYNKHQCSVKEGKHFNEFSLHLVCPCCNDILEDCNKFDDHMKIKHFDRMFYCYQCPVRFSNIRLRNRHFQTQHNNTTCKFCKETLSISIKAIHEAYHLGFGHPCHKCKKAYSNKKKLSYHKSTIHMRNGDKMVICKLCSKSLKLKSFRYHLKWHNNECIFL